MKEIISSVIATIVGGIILHLLIEKWFANRSKSKRDNDNKALEPRPFKTRTFKTILVALVLTLLVGVIFLIWGYNKGYFKSETTINFSEIPRVIQELAAISDTHLLRRQLNEYNNRGAIAVGKKDDFGNLDGFFVFIVDETQVYGTFFFTKSRFFDLQTKAELTNIPEQFIDKQQIWVIEAYKLVQK